MYTKFDSNQTWYKRIVFNTMTECNACTPQHLNPPGNKCHGVPNNFDVQGRGSIFVDVGPDIRHFHVPYLKYGTIPDGYRVEYEPVRWTCTCPDFILHLRRQRCCKHIMMCMDTILPGHSGTVYPYTNYLSEHVFPVPVVDEAKFRQMVQRGL